LQAIPRFAKWKKSATAGWKEKAKLEFQKKSVPLWRYRKATR